MATDLEDAAHASTLPRLAAGQADASDFRASQPSEPADKRSIISVDEPAYAPSAPIEPRPPWWQRDRANSRLLLDSGPDRLGRRQHRSAALDDPVALQCASRQFVAPDGQVNYIVSSMLFLAAFLGFVTGGVVNPQLGRRLGLGKVIVLGAVMHLVALCATRCRAR